MLPLMRKPDWNREGRDWPHRSASRFVSAGGLRWHVQVMGRGPRLLLLHGTGAATHSWRDLAPLLARDFTVIAPDLPGHGFTETPAGEGLSLPGMARGVTALVDSLGDWPDVVVGHSAGAAIALQMAMGGRFAGGVVSLNGALQPFPGMAGRFSSVVAKLVFLNPFAEQMFAWRAAQPGAVARLIQSTGSTIDAAGLRHYEALLRTTGHIAGALGMMANWDLYDLEARLPRFRPPLTLMAGLKDSAIPPKVAEEIHAIIPHSRLIRLPGLGHLAHEEAPAQVADIVREAIGGGGASG
jgi:magnesium chelatase accessory protein